MNELVYVTVLYSQVYILSNVNNSRTYACFINNFWKYYIFINL